MQGDPDREARVPHNLPARLSSFVGRERETADVAALVRSHRLVTLIGAPGVGKTRLSVQIATHVLRMFPDGVWLVQLAPLADPSLVVQAVANVLGVREQPGRLLTATVAEFLRRRQLLLVLDNCEHLIEAAATLADELLRACPHLHMLATSREPLSIDGEVTHRVPSLAVPDGALLRGSGSPTVEVVSQFEAVRLFVERAQAAVSSFTVTQQNAPILAQICARLDGIPLALELAAARVRALSPEQIAARLDDRFQLLTGGNRTALPRQQTLRGAVDWSYDLLSELEQHLLRHLAVFAGGFTLEAAERVGGRPQAGAYGGESTASLLVSLVDKSLVQVEEAPEGERRYRLLETLRAYGWEKLVDHGELADARDRHYAHCLSLAETYLEVAEAAELHFTGPREAEMLARLESEHDNLRAALAWHLGHDVAGNYQQRPGAAQAGAPTDAAAGVRLAGALWHFWWRRGHFDEGRRWLERALALPLSADAVPGQSPPARARFGASILAGYQGDFRTAVEHMEQALTLWQQVGHETGVVMALNRLSFYLVHLGAVEAADRTCQESVVLGRRIGDPLTLASALLIAGMVTEVVGEFERSAAYCEESLALCLQIGRNSETMCSIGALARAVGGLGDLARATQLLDECLRIAHQLGDPHSIAEGFKDLGRTALLGGDPDRAIAMLQRAVPIYQELGAYLGGSLCLHDLAGAWVLRTTRQGVDAEPNGRGSPDHCQSRFAEAARLFAAASALRETHAIVLHPSYRSRYDRDLATLREYLGDAAFARAWAEGRVLSFEEAVGYALSVMAPAEPTPADQAAEADGSPVDADLARLTPREREVAFLVTRGQTNRQIAAHLDLSQRTIDAHVRNILGKLELTTRAQIAVWAVERGLARSR